MASRPLRPDRRLGEVTEMTIGEIWDAFIADLKNHPARAQALAEAIAPYLPVNVRPT
jgi:hypothetical protein